MCVLVLFLLIGLYGDFECGLLWCCLWFVLVGMVVVLCVGVIFVMVFDW